MNARRRYPARAVGGLKIRSSYRIEGYALGDFIGELVRIDLDLAQVRVTDTLRPAPRVRNRCPFPECIRGDFHEGGHEFPAIREQALVWVPWRCAKWVALPAETDSTTFASASSGEEDAKRQPGKTGRAQSRPVARVSTTESQGIGDQNRKE